jgi:hypothetical protein
MRNGLLRNELGGFVFSESRPLAGVTITAPTPNVPSQRTDSRGRFSFDVKRPAGTNFHLIAQKPGFEIYTADPPSGDTTFNISLPPSFTKGETMMRRAVLSCLLMSSLLNGYVAASLAQSPRVFEKDVVSFELLPRGSPRFLSHEHLVALRGG